ncbi:MAG: hypothetical protein J5379_09330 [Clostridiales bacterium]|nr:hypothetical protein [Clostridiales bacterium]
MYRCPHCGGQAIDEPGNDAFVCLSCGKLCDASSVIDDEKEEKDAERERMKEQFSEAESLSKKTRKYKAIAAAIDGLILLVGATVIALMKIRVRKKTLNGDERQGARDAFVVGFILFVIIILLLAYVFLRKDIDPRKADYRIYKIEFTGKYTQSSHTSGSEASGDTCYICYMQNGQEKRKTVSEQEYDIFPTRHGTYYVGAAMKNGDKVLFRVYPEEGYVPAEYVADFY